MAPTTNELKKINHYLVDLTARIKAGRMKDDSEITVQNMMTMVDDGDDNVEEEGPPKTRKQRGKIIKNAIKTIPKLKEMAAKKLGNRFAEKMGDADKKKLMPRYYLPCSPLECNVCGKVKLNLEDSLDHKVLNHTTHIFACDLTHCGSIYESKHEKNKHMQKH